MPFPESSLHSIRLFLTRMDVFVSGGSRLQTRQGGFPIVTLTPSASSSLPHISGTTAQFGGASGDAFSAICGMQIPRFTSSKPSKFAFASDEKSIRQPTTSFVRCYLQKHNCKFTQPSRKRMRERLTFSAQIGTMKLGSSAPAFLMDKRNLQPKYMPEIVLLSGGTGS